MVYRPIVGKVIVCNALVGDTHHGPIIVDSIIGAPAVGDDP